MDGKKELFTLPFLGWLLKIGKNISMEENPKKAPQAMHEAAGSPKCTG